MLIVIPKVITKKIKIYRKGKGKGVKMVCYQKKSTKFFKKEAVMGRLKNKKHKRHTENK